MDFDTGVVLKQLRGAIDAHLDKMLQRVLVDERSQVIHELGAAALIRLLQAEGYAIVPVRPTNHQRAIGAQLMLGVKDRRSPEDYKAAISACNNIYALMVAACLPTTPLEFE